MRVEIIAYTEGAEAFTDTNGNAVFDAADIYLPFDLPELFADKNENGTYDLGEFFVNSNPTVNTVRDIANGFWDGPCLSTVDVSALCSGESRVTIASTSTIVMSTNTARLLATGTFGAPGSNINVAQGTDSIQSGIVVADSNTFADALGSNPMPVGTTIAFSVVGSGVSLVGTNSFTVGSTTGPTGFYGVTLKAAAVVAPATVPAPSTLLLTITPPGAAVSQFSWTVTVTP